MISKVILIGNSDEFVFSMKLFPELLLRLLRERGIEVELIRPKTYFGKLAPWAGPLGKWLFYIDKFVVFPCVLRRVIRRERAAGVVVHVCDHSNAMYVRYLGDIPHLITCHDMMPIKSALGEIPQNRTSWTGKCFQSMILNGMKRARFVACVSTATQCDLLRVAQYPGEQTRVIFNSLNYPYTPMPQPEARARVQELVGEAAPYILHVGGGSWYKNRAGLLKIYAELRRLHQASGRTPPKLIYTGPSLDREIGLYAEQDPEFAQDVINRYGVNKETLRALYSAAELLLFPSWDEGFGWPVSEAQACGCRVVTTNRAPMTEVGGDAAFYIDPHDTNSAAATVLSVLEQGNAEKQVVVERGIVNASRFSEERMIEEYMEVYSRLTEEPEVVH